MYFVCFAEGSFRSQHDKNSYLFIFVSLLMP